MRHRLSRPVQSGPDRGSSTDTGVMMVLVVPCEEPAAEGAGLVDGFKPLGEFRPVFQRLEVGFRERVVVWGIRSAMGFEHPEIRQRAMPESW